MSTHRTQCIACGNDCFCTNDLHALGIGGWNRLKGCGGCENEPAVEFCSEECFHEFRRRFERAWVNYQEVVNRD